MAPWYHAIQPYPTHVCPSYGALALANPEKGIQSVGPLESAAVACFGPVAGRSAHMRPGRRPPKKGGDNLQKKNLFSRMFSRNMCHGA